MMADWPGQKARNRGQLLTGASRSGQGFYYGGRRVLLMDVPGTELVWAGQGVAQFSEDVLEACFRTLETRGGQYMAGITPYESGELLESEYTLLDAMGGRVQLVIGAEAAHTLFQELGTSKHAAQPFIRPTFDWLAPQIGPMLRAESAARGGV